MTLSPAAFDDLPAEPYDKVRPRIRTGDLVLFAGRDLSSRAIAWGTHSPFSHVALVVRVPFVDRIMLLQAVATGVGAVAMSSLAAGSGPHQRPFDGRMVLARHADFAALATREGLRSMSRFALRRFGAPYDMAEILRIMLRIALGWGGLRLPRPIRPRDEYICSEYVYECLRRVGVTLTWDGLGFIAPADIASDPKVEPVAVIHTA